MALLRNWFGEKAVPASAVSLPATESVFEVPTLLLENVPLGNSDGSDGTYQHAPARPADPIWHLGWADGRAGVAERSSLVHSLAQIQLAAWREKVKVEHERAVVVAGQAKLRYEAAAGANTRAAASREQAEVQRHERPELFSFWLGWIYVAVAVLIAITDIPLTLNFASKALGIETSIELQRDAEGRWIRASEDDEAREVRAVDVFDSPGIVLKYLWDAWLIAIGISVLGLSIKIVMAKLLPASEFFESPKWKRGLESASYFGLLVAVILCYCYLAQVRSSQFELRNAGNALNRLDDLGVSADPAARQRYLDKITNLEQGQQSDSRTAFILVSILLPAASGVFLYAGIERSTNHSRLKRLLRDKKNAEARTAAAAREMTDAEQSLRVSEARVAQVSSAELQRVLCAAKEGIYRSRYDRGRRLPETLHPAAGTFDWCPLQVQRELALKLRDTKLPQFIIQ